MLFLYIHKMYQSFTIINKIISVKLQHNRISIRTDDQLFELITTMPESATDELVATIKKEYHAQFNKDFEVSDASIAVEIWGHVYAEKFVSAVKAISPVKLIDELAEKIYTSCAVINIGNKDNDGNRFIWDWLAAFKPAIARLL
jgi:hypothetical protein